MLTVFRFLVEMPTAAPPFTIVHFIKYMQIMGISAGISSGGKMDWGHETGKQRSAMVGDSFPWRGVASPPD